MRHIKAHIIQILKFELKFRKISFQMTAVSNQKDETAVILQRISEQFEKTCLIYLRHENIVNLCEYLRAKLSSYQESDQTQISILVIWILNLMLGN